MRYAAGMDSLMLGIESPTAHYHTLKFGIIDSSAEPEELSYEIMRDRLARNLHLLPPFRWKLLPSPLGLGRPLIVEDPGFDLDQHLDSIDLPAPGDLRSVCSILSEVASTPLDRSRPLWQLYLLKGLENGRVGLLLKIHHAVADGQANTLLMERVFRPEQNTGVPDTTDDWQPDKAPLWPLRLGRDLAHMSRLWATTLPGLIRARRKQAQKLKSAGGDTAPTPPTADDSPSRPWNRLLTRRREVALCSLPFADVLKVKSAFEVSVNDVVLAMVAGVMRSYMSDLDMPLDEPLVIALPFSKRTEEQMMPWGNFVTSLYVTLRTDIADPVERLYAGREASLLSKRHYEENKDVDPSVVVDLMPDLALHSLVPRAIHSKVRKGGASNAANLSISNVAGPRKPLFNGASKLESFFSAGMLNEGTGLAVTVWSYADQFNFSLLACPDLIPDVWKMIDGLGSELDILLAATNNHTSNSNKEKHDGN